MTTTLAAEPDGSLRCRSVDLSYGVTPALRGVSLTVEPGEIVAVTGASGSGKSSLLLCMAGVLVPAAGEVWFDGISLGAESERARSILRRSRFGVLFQFGQLVPELTAEENVGLPLMLNGSGRRAAISVAREWLERFGVAEQASRRPPEMSGGQSQRVAVARAMVTSPDVLFADEPTGALDTLTGERVMTELVGVARELGTTVVLVTHDARVAAWADREVRIRDGMIDDAAPAAGADAVILTSGSS